MRPLAVFLSFSSFSGRALRSTLEVSKSISRRFENFTCLVGNLQCADAFWNEYTPGTRQSRILRLAFTTYLRGFDVIVEVVTECLDVGDDLVSSLASQMPWKEDCGRLASIHKQHRAPIPNVT